MTEARPASLPLLLHLQREARHAEDLLELGFLIVNETFRLVSYSRAVFWQLSITGQPRIFAISGTDHVDTQSSYAAWLHEALAQCLRKPEAGELQSITAQSLSGPAGGDWVGHEHQYVLWCPLKDRNGEIMGGLWLSRGQVFTEAERTVLAEVADCYSHAWVALRCQSPLSERLQGYFRRRRWIWWLAVPLLALLLLPVTQTALAPAEVIACNPRIAAPPVDGVIADIAVRPNQPVISGEVLFRLDRRLQEAQAEIAAKSLAVARAELLRANQRAFDDPDSKAELARLRAQVQEREAEASYLQDTLRQMEVRAAGAGIAVFGDPADWIGRPVRVGERVMAIVDPADTCLRIRVPADDAIAMAIDSPVAFYLNIDPGKAHAARLVEAAYEAEPLPEGGASAYSLRAAFNNQPGPRIGLRGTARIEGDRVTLFSYLARRPFAALRRHLPW